MHAIRIVVTGRVQGVGFRAFVLRRAHGLGLRGVVANHSDGSVQVIAEHDDVAVLDSFVEEMHNGPGWVSSVKTEQTQAQGFSDFSVGDTLY